MIYLTFPRAYNSFNEVFTYPKAVIINVCYFLSYSADSWALFIYFEVVRELGIKNSLLQNPIKFPINMRETEHLSTCSPKKTFLTFTNEFGIQLWKFYLKEHLC